MKLLLKFYSNLSTPFKVLAVVVVVYAISAPLVLQAAAENNQLNGLRASAQAEVQRTAPNQQRLETLSKEANSTANGILLVLGLAAIAASATALLAVRIIVNMSLHPITGLSKTARRVAAGDLTMQVKKRGRDDTSRFANAFDKMIGAIRAIVEQIDGAAGELEQSSRGMAATSDEAGRAIGEVARSISSISEGAAHQVDLVTRAQDVVAEIDLAIAETAATAREARDEADSTQDLAKRGLERASEVHAAMGAVRETAVSSANVVQSLAEKSADIDQIVQTITGIASQTNLLALNAAIEAARAGEQGRGFAVVADEVRKLAEDSRHAAGSIAELIQEIQAETSHAIEAMEAGVGEVERGSDTVASNREAFGEIHRAVMQLRERSVEISDLAQQLSNGSATVRNQIEEVAAVAEQSSASTEQVSASTQETSAAAEQVTASAHGIASTATELAELAGQFKLSKDAA